MEFSITLKMDGQFPGAPNYDTYIVPESVYDLVKSYLEIMPGKKKTSDSNTDLK